MARASHALVADGRVWVIDPVDVDGLDERIHALGEPAGVIQLLDRHRRDCPNVAKRLGVERLKLPFGGVPNSPFEPVPVVQNKFWNEVALWWPERKALIVPESVGCADYFRGGNEEVGIHPMRRFSPPRKELGRFEPEHLLTGHGTGTHGPQTAAALSDSLANARRRIPKAVLSVFRPG